MVPDQLSFTELRTDYRPLLTAVSGVNLKHTSFRVTARAQCDVVFNCAIEILELN